MTSPRNKILQFARSSERGKTERIGTVEGHGRVGSGLDAKPSAVKSGIHAGQSSGNQAPPDSLWSISHFNFHHKRPNGTFVNGPRLEYEVTGVLVRAVITVAFVAALAASCSWLLNRFLEAETAIIHSISSKGGK